ncbi:hypothetical protein KOW79_006985 [Hemibagrus wyckioides]|uniref:Uncharacterized protein n=1 Tax=Hemibagrus wyckioides TaxID=337641 RepID=A0A9D3NSU0_9TELE|nr:hypothetical protein KOW79_006985 [Hemibagrus wyckioides]
MRQKITPGFLQRFSGNSSVPLVLFFLENHLNVFKIRRVTVSVFLRGRQRELDERNGVRAETSQLCVMAQTPTRCSSVVLHLAPWREVNSARGTVQCTTPQPWRRRLGNQQKDL